MAEKQKPDTNLELEIDRMVHEPARLKIMAFLSMLESADFTFLVSRLGLTMGNLSAHVSKLQDAGYIEVEKRFKGNRPQTILSITPLGSKAFSTYKESMLQLLQD